LIRSGRFGIEVFEIVFKEGLSDLFKIATIDVAVSDN
jgi:hypothetical protein